MMRRKNNRLTAGEAEPALVRGVVVAVLGLLATFGVSWAADPSAETIGAIVGVLVVVVPLAQSWWTRRAVTANRRVVAAVTDRGDVVAGDASTVPTGAPLQVGDPLPGAPVVESVPVDPALVNA